MQQNTRQLVRRHSLSDPPEGYAFEIKATHFVFKYFPGDLKPSRRLESIAYRGMNRKKSEKNTPDTAG